MVWQTTDMPMNDGSGGRVQDEFLMLASHELMTPVTSLKLQVQAMKLKVDHESAATPPWAVAMLAVFDRQVGRLADLATDLMLTTRIQAGALSLSFETGDLGATIREVVADVVAQCGVAASSITVDVAESLVGQWDCSLSRALFHLIKNAVTFGEGAPISVEARSAPGGAARITVRDRGLGIAEEDLPRIFGCFERAAPVAHFSGLGLGLYLARAIVLAHGGSIEVESRPGCGATFTVELPLALEPGATLLAT